MKKFICSFAFALVCACVFAQVPSTGLTDGDVRAFLTNYSAIEKDFEKLSINVDAEGLLDNSVAKRKAESVLQKYGMQGPDRVSKLVSMLFCASVAIYEDELKNDPETAALMAQMGFDGVKELRAMINEKDFAVVKKHAKQFRFIGDY